MIATLFFNTGPSFVVQFMHFRRYRF